MRQSITGKRLCNTCGKWTDSPYPVCGPCNRARLRAKAKAKAEAKNSCDITPDDLGCKGDAR